MAPTIDRRLSRNTRREKGLDRFAWRFAYVRYCNDHGAKFNQPVLPLLPACLPAQPLTECGPLGYRSLSY